MNVSDILILLGVACAVAAAVISMRRRKKTGKCSCGCDGCSNRGICGK